jgi:hypothetical protein
MVYKFYSILSLRCSTPLLFWLYSAFCVFTIALQFTFGFVINLYVTFFPPQQQVQTHDDNKCTYDAENNMRSKFQNYNYAKKIFMVKLYLSL